MDYELKTRTGRSFYEVTSAMQNAIRKGDYEVAGYAMWELIPQYTPYLRKRLLVISAEDCFGIITKEIMALVDVGTEESLTRALSLMCLAKKNRDADYFVCNLMYNDGYDVGDKSKLFELFNTALSNMDVTATGRYSYELFKKHRKELWNLLISTANMFYPHLYDEFAALREANERMTKPAEETIFVAKAICLLWTVRAPIEGLLGYDGMSFYGNMSFADVPIIKPLDECTKIRGHFPEWAYNWHTYYGKYTLKRDAVHAIENDQRLLTPLEESLFDDCSWNRDINACLVRHNPNKYKLPYNDGKITAEEKYNKK